MRKVALYLACSLPAGDLTRGGTVEDKVNLAAFCREFKAAAVARGKNYLLTSAWREQEGQAGRGVLCNRACACDGLG